MRVRSHLLGWMSALWISALAWSAGAGDSGWTARKAVDEMTDTTTYFVGREITDGFQSVAFVFLCERDSNHVYALVAYGNHFIAGDVAATTRIGKQAPSRSGWSWNGDQWLVYDGDARSLLSKLEGQGRLTVRVDPEYGDTVTTVFLLDGVQQKVKGMLESCALPASPE